MTEDQSKRLSCENLTGLILRQQLPLDQRIKQFSFGQGVSFVRASGDSSSQSQGRMSDEDDNCRSNLSDGVDGCRPSTVTEWLRGGSQSAALIGFSCEDRLTRNHRRNRPLPHNRQSVRLRSHVELSSWDARAQNCPGRLRELQGPAASESWASRCNPLRDFPESPVIRRNRACFWPTFETK